MMNVFIEDTHIRCSDSTVHSLSWMSEGGLDDEQTTAGWLSCGNERSFVGITYTDTDPNHCEGKPPTRLNFNLRGHSHPVMLVRWNAAYQKLATCDTHGVIYMWIRTNDKWAVELINDRNVPVTAFSWSNDGRMALICYQDGFILVGSVAGRRLWSSSMQIDNAVVTSATWNSDGRKVILGTSEGCVIVLNWQGNILHQLMLDESPGCGIYRLVWSNHVDNQDWDSPLPTDQGNTPVDYESTLAIGLRDYTFYLMDSYDDLCPRAVHTGLTSLHMEWTRSGALLAVGGFTRLPNLECSNEVRFYDKNSEMRYRLPLPSHEHTPLTALTWGHHDERLFVAIGRRIYTACVSLQPPTFQFLALRCIKQRILHKQLSYQLPLPAKLCADVAATFTSTIKGYVPDHEKQRQFVCAVPPAGRRLYCTLVSHCSEGFTLSLEYLGGLLPLLKARKTSTLRPEFVIVDARPKIHDATAELDKEDESSDESDDSENGAFDGCSTPKFQRMKLTAKSRPQRNSEVDETTQLGDDIPEGGQLAAVASNFWGTRFTIRGIARCLPTDLGEVVYKTSLLHMQPRQMCLRILHLCSATQSFSGEAGGSQLCVCCCQKLGETSSHGSPSIDRDSRGSPSIDFGDISSQRSRTKDLGEMSRGSGANSRGSRNNDFDDDSDRPHNLGFISPDVGRPAMVSPTNLGAPLMLRGMLPARFSPVISACEQPAAGGTMTSWAVQAHSSRTYIGMQTPQRDPLADLSTRLSTLHASAPSIPDIPDDMTHTPENHISHSVPSSPQHTPYSIKKRRLRLWRKKDMLACEPPHQPLNSKIDYGLEAFQKAQFSKKLRNKNQSESEEKAEKEFPMAAFGYMMMRNKVPHWNDISQVYQLDFGGRVTQESAKNFQIEYDGTQVLQFGRISRHQYTLDFEPPFSVIQAFAVALANVTQRLK